MGEGPIFNRSEAVARLEGDESLFVDVAKLFVADAESYCSALEAALAGGNMAQLRREAHTVKSVFATFACESGRERALRLEHMGDAEREGAASLTTEVVAEVRRLQAALAEID